MKNLAGMPLKVEFKTVIKRIDETICEMIDKGYVMEERGEFYVVQDEETDFATVIRKSDVIDSNMNHLDFCKCHKFCY